MWRACLVALSLVLLSACITPPVRVIPVGDAQIPYELDAFGIRAPGDDWYLVAHGSRRIGFVRYGKSWDDSWGAEAQQLAIPFAYDDTEAFFARLARERDAFGQDPRFEVLDATTQRARLRGMPCLLGRLQVRDRGAVNRGASLYLLMQLVTLTCLPGADLPGSMIELRFSHRGRTGVSAEELATQARAFFAGLRLRPPAAQ